MDGSTLQIRSVSMPAEVKQQLFSVDETSTILGCSVSSTWRAMREKRLEVVYLGGSTKIKGESIDRLIAGAARSLKIVSR
jgi:Helix-turn-helix domain